MIDDRNVELRVAPARQTRRERPCWQRRLARTLVATAVAAVSCTSVGALTPTPVATSGLSSPLLVADAGDASGRLYVVERGGSVRSLDPATGASSAFLDLTASVLSGSERGLLGLAFHPGYRENGRFFVYYTRRPDGAIVIAEHRRSTGDPARADPAGMAFITIAHPIANHNGGMLAFGPDGYLYIGTGDGGGANDPGNNAQDRDSLLGKMLRIDVDRGDAAAGTAYAIPAGNPFAGGPGRREVFALGLRNPWRFSFDRANGDLWVADVGQSAREEVNAPLVLGGNYGWRVHEGTSCTGNDRTLCDAAGFVAPLFEYTHAGGRCSITGGYVYRGSRGALPPGTYIYGDFCSGEILAWNGATQAVVARTAMSIVSFGEDAAGELYVVDLAGAVHRLDADAAAGAIHAVEYFHAGFGHYFTTSTVDEIARLDGGVPAGWTRTGESFRVHAPGTANQIPVCRFFSADAFAPRSSHFYTPVASECERVRGDAHWQFEGEAYAVALPNAGGDCVAGTRPLYRLYNNGNGGAPNHRYTTDVVTRAAMVAQGWTPEGVGPLGVIGCVPA